MPSKLNYDDLIHLDAEDLAQMGIGASYERPLLKLQSVYPTAGGNRRDGDNDAPRYSVRFATKKFVVYKPRDDDRSTWGKATAFFAIVNEELAGVKA
jgi:hypothetical protein